MYLSPRTVLDNLGVTAQPGSLSPSLSLWGGGVRKQKFKVILLRKSKAALGWFAFHSPSSCARTLKQVSSGGFEISPTQRMFIASLWPRRSAVSLSERPTKSEWHGGHLFPWVRAEVEWALRVGELTVHSSAPSREKSGIWPSLGLT